MSKKKYEIFEADEPFTDSDFNFRFGIHENVKIKKSKNYESVIYEADFDQESAEFACKIMNEKKYKSLDWEHLRDEMERRGWTDPLATDQATI